MLNQQLIFTRLNVLHELSFTQVCLRSPYLCCLRLFRQ